MPFSATTVFITGASRGLGIEFVKQILNQSPPPDVLIAACRNPENAMELQKIAKSSPSVKIVKLDVEKDDDLENAFQDTKAAVGDKGLSLLINNAGIYDKTSPRKLADVTREAMQNHYNVNVSGPIAITQKLLPLLIQAASASTSKDLSPTKAGVVMISSIMGSQQLTHQNGHGDSLPYKCSKSALTMATIMLSRELKEKGIHVMAMHPGWVKTDMGSSAAELSPEESISNMLRVIGNAGDNFNGKLISYKGDIIPF